MQVKKLKLINFRNYKNQDLSFSSNINVIYGDNGQGKTNILEAIFLCASGRSHRTSKDSDLVMLNEPGYYIKLEADKEATGSTIEISYKSEERRKVRINEIPIKKIGELMGNLKVVIFSPEDLMVIKEGPAERRRFMDITLSQLKPSYFYDLQQYMKILSHRNNLLKDMQFNKSLSDTLEIWNQNLITTGSRIIKTRKEFLEKLLVYVKDNHFKLTNQREELELKYSPSVKIDGLKELGDIEDAFKKNIDRLKNKEIMKCTTLCGPQRDDYELYINDKNLKQFGSQGQQRTAVLSVKLAEIDIMFEETGERPILLLDDVMSELDENRQNYLLENIKNIQTFITCTDSHLIKGKSTIAAKLYHVVNGQVIG